MRRFLTASAALLALVAAAGTAMGADVVPAISIKIDTHQTQKTQQTIGRDALAYYGGEITRFRVETWHWQRLTGARLTPAPSRRLSSLTPSAVQRTATEWRIRLAEAHENAMHPPHLQQFLCIHHYEGSWTDTGEPYYGGLQMDRGFQQTYGGWLYATKGTADHWTPIEQIWTAEKALKSRGFWPWPNTARYCGLL
ncbi:MAG: Transglycosylase-like domain [Gaiellaceae bacterium]|nr:Transglycosylase-like domain [Gaiellaceae bacterium]